MSDKEAQANPDRWVADDPRLLRAVRRIIRLYDLEQTGLVCINPESLAEIIASEINKVE